MGGRGDSSSLSRSKGETRGLTFGNPGGSPSLKLWPSRMNLHQNTGDIDKMIRGFKAMHESAPREYAVIIDSYGYAHMYLEGATGSVNVPDGDYRNMHLTHNHPRGGWGNFSGADLISFARGGYSGISAVSKPYSVRKNASEGLKRAVANRRSGTYKITKTQHFKGREFEQALKNVRVRDDNYDKDLHKWLVRNQSRFGYKYSYKR